MKMKNGFTLVELLAVIIIISLLMAVAIPSSITISNKINQNLLAKKIDFAEKSAILWGQDNKKCFTTSGCSEYPNTLDSNCTVNATHKTCKISFELLAVSKYLEYDEKQKVINPADKEKCLNNYQIAIKYTKKSKIFTASIVETAQDSSCPK